MYHLNGLAKITWRDDQTWADILKLLMQLRDEPVRADYSWVQKYRHTKDLRPQAYDYSDLFITLLAANNIHEQLQEITGRELWLSHIQVRRVAANRRSYMDWHRDTHFYDGKLVGNLPPVHKIIYYPALGDTPQPALNVSLGSHRRVYAARTEDQAQVGCYPVATVMSNDNEALLFETSLLHSVVPHRGRHDALRVMYSFCEEWQIEGIGKPELHRVYQQRVAGLSA
jgi:hypothetical protein